ncbi:MAG: sulfatase-like hydrolase/transferase [Clostridia bacterium]|nr:sulfatase-like hydrolase/transferase [Clostridia bacterium]
MKNNKALNIVFTIAGILVLTIGYLCFFAADWYIDTFGNVGFDSIMFTLFSDAGGTEAGVIKGFLLFGLLPTFDMTAITSFLLFFKPKKSFSVKIKEKSIKLYPLRRGVAFALAVIITIPLIAVAANKVELTEYVISINEDSTIFEDKYVDPKTVEITFPEEKQNLIYIFLESVETSFFSKALGGGNNINPIPELYKLADENLNFSSNDSVGGFYSLSGGTWTIAAMVSQTAGIPLKVPNGIDRNEYGADTFLPGVTTINQILAENGYNQAVMVGSEAKFGGREAYFTQHGVESIYDLFTAWDEGLVENGRKVWWGFEDHYLFDYAKEKITELASKDEPFAFTTLTVDTHFTDGYVCRYCDDIFDEQYENVLACSSKQVYEFVEWIKAQPFFENTTVIICGDHPTMDNQFIKRKIDTSKGRRVYNCIINSRTETEFAKNREFCSLDMFPTTLAAIGCTIEGDRLGLGTNMFSGKPTLCEEMGAREFNEELKKSSPYYAKNFRHEE